MITLIYAKTLEIQAGIYDESSALTLMSTDLDRLTLSIESVCEIWATFIEMIIGLWLLQRQLGWVCFAPIVIVGGILSHWSTSTDTTDPLSMYLCIEHSVSQNRPKTENMGQGDSTSRRNDILDAWVHEKRENDGPC